LAGCDPAAEVVPAQVQEPRPYGKGAGKCGDEVQVSPHAIRSVRLIEVGGSDAGEPSLDGVKVLIGCRQRVGLDCVISLDQLFAQWR
jgi:hypothetical protein